MSDALIARILKLYGYQGMAAAPPQTGYRNESYKITVPNGETLNLILYKREAGMAARIGRANRAGDFLAGQGFPARRTADPRIIKLSGPAGERYAALYHYLPGTTIPWEAYTMAHLKHLGAAMSRMHQLLGPLPAHNWPRVTNELQTLAARMNHYFADEGVQAALASKLGLRRPPLSVNFVSYQKLEGQQPLHLDFVRGNILFDDQAQIIGVLDFEKTAVGHPAFDIARTLAFLLVDCKYKTEASIRKYFLDSGYSKRGPMPLPPATVIEPLVNFFLLHDFYKFLRHNPYESLPKNEHFMRTRTLLLERGIVKMVK